MPRKPKVVPINHDAYHAKHVGHMEDGRQFFLTHPFTPGQREFVALYLFDRRGVFLEAKIHDLGRRENIDHEETARIEKSLLESLGAVTNGRIRIEPFKTDRFDTVFGLIAEDRDDEDDDWCFIFEPGNVMAFYPPWNGDYDT